MRRQRMPWKVLEAPRLQDDFYLNLVDWGSSNILAVGLGSAVYMWSALTSQVTRLCDVGTADAIGDPDLNVRSTLGGLLAQIPFLRPSPGVGVGKMKIAGDADLARQLQKLAERFDPDWNLPFTDLFGDVLGVQVASAARAAFRTGRDGAMQLARHGVEFLTEESRDLVGRAELDAHLDDVDALRDRVERLAARMQHLQHKLADAGAPPADENGAKP